VRFTNGEVACFVVTEPIDARNITGDIKYGIVTSVTVRSPHECSEVSVFNLRDITFVKTERVTMDQLAAEHRMAGIRSPGTGDDRLPKTVSQIRFV
jgi:hypothetical protein